MNKTELLKLIKLGEAEIKQWQKFVDKLKKQLREVKNSS